MSQVFRSRRGLERGLHSESQRELLEASEGRGDTQSQQGLIRGPAIPDPHSTGTVSRAGSSVLAPLCKSASPRAEGDASRPAAGIALSRGFCFGFNG